MKANIIFVLVFIMGSAIFGQGRGEFSEKQRGKIQQLKKMKLIETLDLTEDESTRFFVRYNEFQKGLDYHQKNRNKLIDEFKQLIKGGEGSFEESKYNELIKKLQDVDNEHEKSKQNFIKGLNEVLPKYKIAKLIVFEREFMDHLKKLVNEFRVGRNRD